MDASLLQAAISAKLKNLMNRLYSARSVRPAPDARLDSAALSSWLADQRERRARESAIAEEPPLPIF
jgi:hypothetical protein